MDFPGRSPFSKEDYSWNLAAFIEHDMEFDLIGIDASIANALRRIMISEVPTMAIEKVYVHNNTSVMHDEILSHRLGLVPILADPRLFQFKENGDGPTDLNTIVFKLNVKCEITSSMKNKSSDPLDTLHSCVYSRDLKWVPEGDQEERFANSPIKPVHDDILLVKLRPGQQINLDLHCQKGIGKEHAKWSPVATASYRLLPEIRILSPITGASAFHFQKCFPPSVIDVFVNENGEHEARVSNARKDTVSREVLRFSEFEGKVELLRVRDHFIFSVESSGILPPHTIFEEALLVLINKCKHLKKHLTALDI
ncbi:DNA-directed RNA polymerases I and III subunit RPAC1 [Dinochytrium kinnereticum]|nr:DNA-directed RNA polymerases I and III subunit RPAC1 [Dinochytrium kinnereticum]